MKPEADATTKSWVTAAPCPWCLAFAGDLPCASRHKVMCLGEQFASLLRGWLLQARQGVWLPKHLWPDAVQDFSQKRRAAVAQLGAAALGRGSGKLGHCHPSGWGHCWCPPRATSGCLGVPAAVPPVPCRLFACSQEKEAEAGAFKGFFKPG